MKTIKKNLKKTSLFFTLLTFLQACRVYHTESVTLQEAVKAEKRVKIRTKSNKTYKFQKVVLEDGRFYGINNYRSKEIKYPLDYNELRKVRLHDKTLSMIFSIGLPVVIIGMVVLSFAQAGLFW